jgi:catechol 2,3-dioxygenase-like lactoylglutathione lyase family enzyme
MFVGINHVTIIVKDKSEAENFYCNILGLEKINIGNILWIKVGNQFIHINENPYIENPNSFRHFAIEVDDLIPYLKSLISKEINVFDLSDNLKKTDMNINLEKENRNYFIEDPSGNIIEFVD